MSDADRKAQLADLLERNERRIVAIARSYAAPSDVPDLVQEILLQVWRSLRRFRGTASIDTWTYRIALNVALTWRRSHQRRRRWLPKEAVDPDSLGLAHADGSEAERFLREFVPSLGEIDRAILLLYLDGVSHPQIAEILDMAENTVSVRLHRIRQRCQAFDEGV